MQEPDLRKCPFCGGDAILAKSDDDPPVYFAGCRDSRCRGYVVTLGGGLPLDAAAAAWNKRATVAVFSRPYPHSESHLLRNPEDLRGMANDIRVHAAWLKDAGAPAPAEGIGPTLEDAAASLDALAREREGGHLTVNLYGLDGKPVKAEAMDAVARIAPLLPHEGEARVCGMVVRRDFDRIRVWFAEDVK